MLTLYTKQSHIVFRKMTSWTFYYIRFVLGFSISRAYVEDYGLLFPQLKELSHDNIKSFIGACIEPGRVCYLMQCCSRGTIQVSFQFSMHFI